MTYEHSIKWIWKCVCWFHMILICFHISGPGTRAQGPARPHSVWDCDADPAPGQLGWGESRCGGAFWAGKREQEQGSRRQKMCVQPPNQINMTGNMNIVWNKYYFNVHMFKSHDFHIDFIFQYLSNMLGPQSCAKGRASPEPGAILVPGPGPRPKHMK